MPLQLPPDDKLADKIRRLVASTSAKYGLISPNDRILIAVSGGKDSLTLVRMLADIRRKNPWPFHIVAATIDGGFANFDFDAVQNFCSSLGVEYRIIREPLFDIISKHSPPNEIPCMMCARIRRGVLYTYAQREGFDSIALGHHRDDLIETVLMNMFFNARIASMPPRLVSDDGKNTVIRPLAAVPEEWIARFAEIANLPVQHPLCPLMPNGEHVPTQREAIKQLLAELEQTYPHIKSNLFAALSRVQKRHLL